jgi:NTP pyrophosphatase (non-canonical NTP hydrolase)
MNRVEVFNRVNLHREVMDRKWGDKSIVAISQPHFVTTLLTEEVGEVARAVLEEDKENLKAELLDVIQIACAWLEALD